MTFFLITEIKSIHSLTYSWLQAAQDFHEEQDRKNNETLRESYRIRLGGKQYFEMLILECFFTYFLFTPLISRKQNSLISIMLLIDFLSRRPLNSELFLFIFLFFFSGDICDTTVREGILLLVKHKVENFLSFIVTHHISFYWETYLYLFLFFHWFLLIPCLFFKFNLKKDTPIWRRAFSFQVLITKDNMLTTTARSSWDFIHVPS